MHKETMHVYDTDGGRRPEAAEQFIQAVIELVNNDCNFDITITAGNHTLKAYDNAQFVTSLLQAVEDYKNDIC